MTFAKKFDLLMKITNTTNSVLAHSISMDASFISRLRRGLRIPAKNVNYIEAMSAYFARNCRAEYQKAALWEAIKSSSKTFQQDANNFEEIIYTWLRETSETSADTISAFLDGVTNFQFKKEQAAALDVYHQDSKNISEVQVFYGVEGKQNAVLTFLSMVLQSNKPQTLLLYSNEDLGWLTGNPEFTLQWANLLMQVIKSGHKIKIIHTIIRDFDEMLSAIKQWVPLYMTGSIEPYYYPRIRDGLFRRTLFIAPQTAAVTSSSVASGTKNAANFLFTDKNTVKALIEEYNGFLSLCRMLMRIFTPAGEEDYLALLAEFEDDKTDTIVKTDTLTNITMPVDVVKHILDRLESPDKEQLLAYQQQRIEKFINSLQKNHFTELLSVPGLEQILAGKVAVNFSDMLNESLLFYTPWEYSRHLANIIRLLKQHDNFHVHLVSKKPLEGSIVYVREGVGVLVGKTMPPSVVFAINESNMTAAFWDYMSHLTDGRPLNKKHRQDTITKLEAIVARLEESLQA
jgi:hypothetical protein